MPNLDTIVKGLNKRKLNGNTVNKKQDDTTQCNGLVVCDKGCIANHKCEKTSVVYKATVYINDNKIYKRTYAGMTGGKFKKRISSHYSDFKYASGKKSTSLSKFIWKLQSENTPFQIEWDTLESARSYKKGDRFCQLCVCEKKWIAMLDPNERINTSDEFVSKCPHKRKYKLGRIQNTSKSLTEENQKLRDERDCYKRLLEINQQNQRK